MTEYVERFWSKVDKSGECWTWTAAKQSSGYGEFFLDGTMRMAHRVSYEMQSGPIPAGMDVDHICHTRLCVRPSHLRAATRKQNVENHSGARRDSMSGIRGVYWYPSRSKWNAQVQHNGRLFNLGYFLNVEDAAAAVRSKRLELFTHNDFDRSSPDA